MQNEEDRELGALIRQAMHNGVCVYFQAPLDARDKSWYVEACCVKHTARAKKRWDSEKKIDGEIVAAVKQIIDEVSWADTKKPPEGGCDDLV